MTIDLLAVFDAGTQLDPQELKKQLPLTAVCASLDIALDRNGYALCPFHADSEPSFYLWEGSDGIVRWWCQPCARGGDAFSLIQEKKQLSFPQAVDYARDLLDRLPHGYEPPSYVRSAPPVSIASFAYRIDSARSNAVTTNALDEYVLRAWGWGVDADGVIFMPHWNPAGELTGCKLRRPDGSKTSLPGSRFGWLYGAWLHRRHPRVLLCEGESDTVHASLQNLGADVYGLPRGAGADIELTNRDVLQEAELYLAFDGDDAGHKATLSWKQHYPDALVLPVPDGHDLRSCEIPVSELMSRATRIPPLRAARVQEDRF